MKETKPETQLATSASACRIRYSRYRHNFIIAGVAAMASSLLAPAALRAQITSPSAVYDPASNPITVFVSGPDGELYDNYYNGSKWVWQTQGIPRGLSSLASPSAVYDPTSNF